MTAARLSAEQRARLVQLLGMTGSDFAGERANAASFADRFVKSLGLVWDDVIAGGVAAQQEQHRQEHKREQQKATPAAMAQFCLDSGLPWNSWEAEFLNDMQFRWKLTPKQLAVLERLYAQAKARTGR